MSTTARYLSELGASTVKSSIIPAGSVMVSCIGSDMGKSVIAKQRCVTNQQINSVVVDTKFSSEFVYYNLSMRKAELQHLASGGSTMPILNKGMFSEVKIDLPPLAEQLQIAETLSALDDRITLLRGTNATLEAIAQALFKSWFVDFDPVRAKLEGRAPEGMDEATARLFPDSFEESELGLVPTGWQVGTVGDIASVKGGFAYKSADFCDAGFPVIKIKNIVGDGTVDLLDTQFIGSEMASKTSRFALKDSDIVMAMTGATIGKSGVVVTTGHNAPYLNQRVAKFEPNKQGHDNRWLVFVAFQNSFMFDQVVNAASGSAQPNISTNGIESVRLTIPCRVELLTVFSDYVDTIFQGWMANQKQAQTLATLRDTLLPRLISGQLQLQVEINLTGEGNGI